jgi:hypothetical protein
MWQYILNIRSKYYLWKYRNNLKSDSTTFLKNGYYFPPSDPKSHAFARYLGSKISRETILSLKQRMMASSSISDYTTDLVKYLDEEARLGILDYALNNRFLADIASYLDFLPRLAKVELMFNVPKLNMPMGSMKWHRDSMSYKYVNIFMCITGIHENNGKYSVIGKNTIDEIANIPYDKVDTGKTVWDRYRIDDDQMFRFVTKEAVVPFLGEPGSLVLVDAAACYHKGGYCLDDHRIMLQLSYATELEDVIYSVLDKLNLVGHPRVAEIVDTPMKKYMLGGEYQSKLSNRLLRSIIWRGYRVFSYELPFDLRQNSHS